MPVEIVIPALTGDSTEANLLRWIKNEGDAVKVGDPIAEIETDKAIVEVTATHEGRLGRILVPAGTQGVKAEQVLALLIEKGEGEAPPAAPQPSRASAEPTPLPQDIPSRTAVPVVAADSGGRIFASPLARRLAAQAGLDLSRVSGSGPHGRIVKADVEAAPRSELPVFTEIPHSMMRKTIARRLAEAKREAPHFYLRIDCNIDALLELRREINAARDANSLSVNDFVIRAAALALKQVPAANASWTDTCMRQYRAADISVAVATRGGLITPVVRNADSKSLDAISMEMKDLAARAQAGKLKPEEYRAGTFSVSNLGMYGIRDFAAVINPPQAAILAIGAAEPRPSVRDGALVVATVMTCTLSADHRVVDGVIGAEFLAAFRKLIEEPRQLLAG